jgi:hypothetical protein
VIGAVHLALDCVPSRLIGIGEILGINAIVLRGIGIDTVVQQVQNLQLVVGLHYISPDSVRLKNSNELKHVILYGVRETV